MHKAINILCTTSLIALQLASAVPALAGPGDRNGNGAGNGGGAQARPGNGGGGQSRPGNSGKAQAAPRPAGGNHAQAPNHQGGGYAKPASGNYGKPAGGSYGRPASANDAKPEARPAGGGYAKPATAQSKDYRPGTSNAQAKNNYSNAANRPGNAYPNGGHNNVNVGGDKGGNTVNNVNVDRNVNVSNNGYANRYPPYRPAGGGYYRPPNGGYYGPPRPPYGGWHGGYYPPPRYYYNDGPSVGGVLFGVAVTTSLLALLSAANQPQTVYVQGAPPPPLPAYVPPPKTSGAPASINVNLNAMDPAARPSASTCLTEASRQIGATGGREIRVGQIIDVEPGNGGYRFRLILQADYPDATRDIPMYCRATPEKIVELTFG